ncbi:hypothetical protein HI914_02939 [Erysiphe necator]|nr:hypothetical protein HI914_02939 [Erysiphe necator]
MTIFFVVHISLSTSPSASSGQITHQWSDLMSAGGFGGGDENCNSRCLHEVRIFPALPRSKSFFCMQNDEVSRDGTRGVKENLCCISSVRMKQMWVAR